MPKNTAFMLLLLGLPWLSEAEETTQQSCGAVSVSMKPPATRDLFDASIAQVDGNNIIERPIVRVAPGKHTFKVYEHIEDPRLAVGPNARGRGKLIEIEVEANMRYHIAAKFVPEQRFTNFTRYWEPVVWKTSVSECTP